MKNLDGSAAKTPMALASAYGLALAVTVVLFLIIRKVGESLPVSGSSTASIASTAAPEATGGVLGRFLLALATVVVACQVMSALFRWLGQPPVVGEVLAGILLGPSLLGRVAPGAAAFLLPEKVAPIFGLLSQLGVILYMFMVGLELDTAALTRKGGAAAAISHASIVLPFLLGALLALGLYPTLSIRGVPFTVFALFLGVAMSVTAFPVLARILTDRGMSRSPIGVLALTCAAVDDVTAWCLSALVVGMAQADVGRAVFVILGSVAYTALMLWPGRPLLARLTRFGQDEELSRATTARLLVALLLSACATEVLGTHAVFGAFLLGAVIPSESPIAGQFVRKTQDLVAVLLLPAFFAYTGMRTRIGLVSGPGEWLLCGLIVAMATLGKFGGTLAAARLTGSSWRDASTLGILLNTRGLMELVVLNIGLDLGVVSPKLFAMMVVMALVTTLATTPLLQLFGAPTASPAPARGSGREPEANPP